MDDVPNHFCLFGCFAGFFVWFVCAVRLCVRSSFVHGFVASRACRALVSGVWCRRGARGCVDGVNVAQVRCGAHCSKFLCVKWAIRVMSWKWRFSDLLLGGDCARDGECV